MIPFDLSHLPENGTILSTGFVGLGQVVHDSGGYYFLPYNQGGEPSPRTTTPESCIPIWVLNAAGWMSSTMEWCHLRSTRLSLHLSTV
jgi:hypothetical protein